MLRPYQEQAIKMLRQSLRTGHKRPILQMPTGSGKTNVAAAIIASALSKGKRVGFLVDKLVLVDQAVARLSDSGISVGVLQGIHELTDPTKPVQVISVQTLHARIKRGHAPDLDLIIVDEAHVIRDTVLKLMQKWDNVPFIGLSATPWSKGLGKWWDDLVIPTTTSELIKQGYLVDADYYAPTQFSDDGIKVIGGDYNRGQLSERVNKPKIIGDLVSHWFKLGGNKPTICMAVDIAHSKHIAQSFNDAGVPSAHIDCYTDSSERRKHIKAFKEGVVKVLSSVAVLSVGFDEPSAEVLVGARPTKSRILWCQGVGRVMRPYNGKNRATVIDHSGNCLRLGLHTDPVPNYLDDGSPPVNGGGDTRDPPLPKPCPKCSMLKPAGIWECPGCGFKPERQNTVEVHKGELHAVKVVKATPKEKHAFYAELLGYCFKKGYKKGFAAHKYKDRYGVWPRFDAAPLEPSAATMNYIKHLAIKRSFRKNYPLTFGT